MKKLFTLCIFTVCLAFNLFAYNPPFGGEDVFRLSNPVLLSGGSSTTGGPSFLIVPSSIAYNPALTAIEQRSILNLSGTFLLDKDEYEGMQNGFGLQLGLVIPTKWLVFTGTLQGLFDDNERFDVGHSVIVHLGASKDVTDRLYLGAALYTGFYTGHGTDFSVGLDLGGLYQLDDISILKKPRIGVSLLNLGKPIGSDYTVTGIDGTTSKVSYPGIITPKGGFAATLLEISDFQAAFSADLSFPSFQNVIFDVAVGLSYRDMVSLNFGWNCNARELAAGGKVNMPSIGINIKFAISSDSEKIKESWRRSEIVPSVAWQNLNGGIHAISAGASLYLGMQDAEAPTIVLWNELATDEDVGEAE